MSDFTPSDLSDREAVQERSADDDEDQSYRRPHRRRHGNSRRARVCLAVLFVVFASLQIVMYLHVEPSRTHLPRFMSALINDAIWTTALMLGVWLRQKWARYILIAFQLLSVFGVVLASCDLLEPGMMVKDSTAMGLVVAAGLAHAVCAWLLICSRDFKRLTSHSST